MNEQNLAIVFAPNVLKAEEVIIDPPYTRISSFSLFFF